MWTNEVELLHDVSPADWIRPRLARDPSHVTATIPAGFDAYARILHPVEYSSDLAYSWADVAAVTGGTVHPQVQWHTLVGAPDPWSPGSGPWQEGAPDRGNLARPQLIALCEVLARHTGTPDDCYFALWDGWAQLTGSATVMALTTSNSRRRWLPSFLSRPSRGIPIPAVLARSELAAPHLHLPNREYLLFRGPLAAMDALVHYDGPGTSFTQSPALFWPADRAWCVATEIDFTTTLVAATTAGVDDVVAHPALEAFRLTGTESLGYDSDTVNG